MRQKVEIEVDVPDGWRAVAYRIPQVGEWIMHSAGHVKVTFELTQPWLILEKVEPKRESRWLNVYRETAYDTLKHANEGAGTHRKGCIRIDYEDGKLVAVTLEPEGEP